MSRASGRGPGQGSGRGPGRDSGRGRRERLKTAKGRKTSSTRWLSRQLRDPYVAEAQDRGLRSRAAFKLIELDDRFGFLKPGRRVVDLGSAPGGWTAVAAERVKARDGAGPKRGQVVAIDVNDMDPVPGAVVLTGDFMDDDAPRRLVEALDGAPDVVLSDMAAPTTGHAETDHLRVMALLEAAAEFAFEVLAPGGTFVGKVFQGGTEQALLTVLKKSFKTVRHAKPPASRKESAETYVVALGFRGKSA